MKPDERMKQFRGAFPLVLRFRPTSRLYVACSGINAVAVSIVKKLRTIGYIPTGCFPAKLKVSNDGRKLMWPLQRAWKRPERRCRLRAAAGRKLYRFAMKGTVQVLDIPSDQELDAYTRQVVSNNFHFEKAGSEKFAWRKNNPVPLYPGEKESPIRHIVFISKENRTYDEVFGQIGNAKGDPALARYGTGVSFKNSKGTDSVQHADVMVNHLKLARDFAVSDNFYVDSDVSADGHRWLVNTYPNEWTETCTAASYGGNRKFVFNSKAPGVYAMNGAAGAIYPEDYNEAGSMWTISNGTKLTFIFRLQHHV